MKMAIGAAVKGVANVLFWIWLAYYVAESGMEYVERIHGYVRMESEQFAETDRQINNPNRGFYVMHGFVPSDEKQGLGAEAVKRLQNDSRKLALVQINLRNYTEGPLSEQALQNISDLFKGLEQLKKQYIVRFLYDWNGKNLQTEPESVDIILEHMRQLEGIFTEYADIIFVQQGVFIGDCGEMHSTKHMGSLQQLMLQLAAVTGENTYVAVRTPVQWRIATGTDNLTEESMLYSSLVRRLSLFNDGMMGNSTDYGTYGTKTKTEAGPYSAWNREEELAFQEELCKYVPNGGEVIINNPLNDFESAVENFSMMHVTYLNIDYDRNVLNKWADTTVTEEGVFYGMDGLSYMERHLGYRLFISKAELGYDIWEDKLEVKIDMKNVGFAPLYKEPEKLLTIRNKATGEERKYAVDVTLRTLVGGNEKDTPLAIRGKVSLAEYLPGEYEVFLSIRDVDSDTFIELANEQEMQENGYKLGELTVEEMPELSLSWEDIEKAYENLIKDKENYRKKGTYHEGNGRN